MAKEDKDIAIGLDIGTSKVMAIVAEIDEQNTMKVLGLGVAPSNGMKRGVVVNIEACVQSIQEAVREAEMMAACKINKVITGISGSHIRGRNSAGMVAVRNSNEVTGYDVDAVLETARAINISTDQLLILDEPQEFMIDGQSVKEPIGMSGVRLEAKVHIVTCALGAAENVMKCVRRCGLQPYHVMLNPMASNLSCLTDSERELGVVLVDIGAGTTDIAVFAGGALRHTAVLPVAGELITNDIAMALRTPTESAEDIKINHGCAKALLADAESHIEVDGLNGRPSRLLGKDILASVIEPRVEEIFALVQKEIQYSGLEHLISGVVLTGGTANMRGMVELGEDIFLKPVRVGQPIYNGALADMVCQPRAAVAMGMLEDARNAVRQQVKKKSRGKVQESKSGSLIVKIKEFIVGNF